MSYFRKRGGLVAAMEDRLAADTESTEPVIDMDEETAEGVDAIADETAESEAITDDLEDASDDLKMIGSIINTAQSTVTPDPENPTEEPEGMDEVAAEIAQEAISRAFARLGIHPGKIMVPSTEAFKSANSRVMATQAAVESWKKSASRAWQAFVDAIKQMWERFMKFLDGLFNQVTRMRKTIIKMKKAVETTSRDTGSIRTRGWGSAFAHKGVDAEGIIAVLGNQSDATEGIKRAIGKFEVSTLMYGAVGSAAKDNGFSTEAKEFVDLFGKAHGFERDSNGYIMKGLVGGKTIKIGLDDKSKVTVSFDGEAGTPPDKTARHTVIEMNNILSEITGILNDIDELKRYKYNLARAIEKTNASSDFDDPAVPAVLSEILSVSFAANKFATAVLGMNIKACAAAIKAVSASLNDWKPNDEKI